MNVIQIYGHICKPSKVLLKYLKILVCLCLPKKYKGLYTVYHLYVDLKRMLNCLIIMPLNSITIFTTKYALSLFTPPLFAQIFFLKSTNYHTFLGAYVNVLNGSILVLYSLERYLNVISISNLSISPLLLS